MNSVFERPIFGRLCAIVGSGMLANVLRIEMINGEIFNYPLINRCAIAFGFWAVLVTAVFEPPKGLLVTATTFFLVSIFAIFVFGIDFTYNYVISGSIEYTNIVDLFVSVSIPVFFFFMVLMQIFGNNRQTKGSNWIAGLATDPIFTILGIVCSVFGTVLAVWQLDIWHPLIR